MRGQLWGRGAIDHQRSPPLNLHFEHATFESMIRTTLSVSLLAISGSFEFDAVFARTRLFVDEAADAFAPSTTC